MLIIRRLTSSGLLLLALAGCNGKDTGPSDRWPRAIEPRISVATKWVPCEPILSRGHVVRDSRCASASTLTVCDNDIVDAAGAREAVAFRSPCLDRAIAYLQKASRRNAGALTDLAAAYYVRAQRDDRTTDLLRALNAAEEAVAVHPAPPGAYFNEGLVLESLGLKKGAAEAWARATVEETGEWSREARAHRDTLVKSVSDTGERRWALAEVKIANALANNNEKAIEAIIAPFPFTARKYFENVLLPKWAEDPPAIRLAQLKIFAMALSATAGDNYARDIAASIDNAAHSPARLADLKDGYTALQRAHVFEGELNVDAAAQAYRAAADLLKRGSSPLYLGAEIGEAGAMINEEGNAARQSLTLFAGVAQSARDRGYTQLPVNARANIGYALSRRDRYIEALAAYDEVLAYYQRTRDWEGLANTQARRIGILRLLGQYEAAFRAALPFVHDVSRIVDWKTHHLLIGETAAIATQIGCPRSALALLNAEVQHFADELKVTAPEDKDRVLAVESHIAIARRNRAAAELQLGQYPQAQSDLTQVARLTRKSSDVSRRRALEARLDEIRGMSLLHTDPNGAAAELAKAASLDGEDYTSFRVAVLVERAQALRRAGRPAEAEADIRAAVSQVAREEAGTLADRKLDPDPIWNGYFDRFRDAYDLLIRQLVEEGRTAEALAYNEQSHALEPLDLILRSGFAAAEVKDLAAATPPLLLSKIQGQLPADTYLVEYRVLGDVTYAWVVSHDTAQLLTLQATRSDAERWTATLQAAAAARDRAAFGSGLYAPYDRLIAPVIAAIHPTEKTRLVFVPDEFMHALPFAALRNPNGGRYLIEEAPLSIAGSGTLYIFSLLRDRALKPQKETAALLVGDPAFDPRYAPGASRLEGARGEVEELRLLYGPQTKELVGEAATAPRFLQDARESQIVHVAAHAITDGEAPSQSFLLLAPSASDTGVLDAQTLLKTLRLPDTRLVVLGACRSGGSVAVGPQGVAPLLRPFLAAGVPGLIGTLWDINDATAKEVLVSFHRHYRHGSDAAAALRAAQIELLRNTNPGLSSELTWAAYQAIGYASSPFAPSGEMEKEKPPP